MIDKVTPQGINSDADSRVRPSSQMIDALNIAFEQSYKDSMAGAQTSDFSGDFTSLKPMTSNQSIEDIYDLDLQDQVLDDTQIRVIGSVSDDIFNLIFFFVWSDDPNQMGVWAWDQEGLLPGSLGPGRYIKVYCSEKFNFPSDGFVKGDVVHMGQREYFNPELRSAGLEQRSADAGNVDDGGDNPGGNPGDAEEPPGYIDPDDRLDRVRNILLYFTDNRNEPKKLDVFKVMSMPLQALYQDYNNDDLLDLICACPRTPQTPITFVFDFDNDRPSSNFINLPGMQFAYQYIYDDNVESAISAYSKIAIPPAYIQMGAATGSPFLQNRCRLLVSRGTREVKHIRLLVRYGNAGSFRTIDVLRNTNGNSPLFGAASPTILYDFYNDRVLVPVSQEEQNAQYSNLPRVAQAQTIVSDRLMYGNYLENYPEVETTCTSEVIYGGTPEAGYAIELKVTPFIVAPNNYANQATVSTVGNSRVAGCYIDLSGVPSGALGAGSIMNVSWSMMPDDNFHIYNHHKSYHGTSERYFGEGGVGDYLHAGTSQSADIQWNGEYDPEMEDFYREGRSTFGKNKGVRFLDGVGGEADFNKWKYQRPDLDSPGNFIQEEIPCVYGTSAANPLILKGDGLYFELTVQTLWAIPDNPQDYIKNALYSLLTDTPSMMPMQNGVPLLQTVGDSNQVEYVQNIDLGLNGNVQTIGVTSNENDERKNLICSLLDANIDNPEHQEPIGYFIVNEATATWGLTAHPDMEGLGGEDNVGLFLGLSLKSLTGIDVRTCIPNIPWDYGGYQVGIPNSSASEYIIENSGENDENWGNIFFNLNNPSTGVSVRGWMPPQIMNCTVTKWKTFSSNYLNGSDPTNIVGNAPWDNIKYPYNTTQFSDIGHKNLLFAQPQGIVNFLMEFQQDGDQQDNNYNVSLSTSVMGAAAFPCMSEGLNRYKTIGVLTGPSGDTNITSLIDSPSRVSNHYGDSNCMFSLVDGEGNMGHSEHGGAFDMTMLSTTILESLNEVDSTLGSVLPVQVFTGQITPQLIVNGGIAQAYYGMAALGFRATPLKHLRTPVYPGSSGTAADAAFPDAQKITHENWIWDAPGSQGPYGLYYLGNAYQNYDELSSYGGNGTANNNWVEIVSENSTVALAGGEYYHRSFKTRAHHEFGIVYYDQRGRSGHVNYLTNTYVKGYSDLERPAQLKGRADIMLHLYHYPPRWSTHYQIVYGGNSTIGDFVQYTTGLAFVEDLTTQEASVTTGALYDTPVDSDDAIIYVSLGYLQGENNASYSHAFGAMRKDGSKDLYTYSEGDKLRIKQYTDQDGVVQYPDSDKYEFEVVGVKTMTSNAEENIIHTDSGLVPMTKSGQFLMLKSNPMATGFRYVDVNGDMPMAAGDYIAQYNNWNNRCIVEIYSPKSVRDYDDRLYYEVGEKYDIVLNEDGDKVHSENNILLKDGDVYWRNIPVNETIKNTSNGLFYSILQGTSEHDGNTSKPRFRNYFLESDTFTDTIPEADGKDWGKVKVIVPKAQTLYKRSSVCFSDKNNYSAKRNSYTMFNGSKFNYKDLPNEYGSINYILNDYDSLFVIQEDKASSIPVSRSIISTAGGQESLIAADKILGAQKYYQGDYGADGNPESVVRAEENIYWASKSRREVYKWSRSKAINVISNIGMKAYFNNIFKRALEDQAMGGGRVRVVGGYDSLRDEFIISIHNMYDFSDDEGFYDFEYDGEYITGGDDGGNGGGGNGGGNGGGGGDPDGPVEPDFPDDPDEPIKECPELTFSSFTSGSLSEMQPGDQATVTLTFQNTSSETANLSNADIYPIPSHITSIEGINGLPLALPPGGSISFVFNITIPNNYSAGIYTYNTTFHYDGRNPDCPKESIEFPIELEVDKPPRPDEPGGGGGDGGGDPDVDEPGGDHDSDDGKVKPIVDPETAFKKSKRTPKGLLNTLESTGNPLNPDGPDPTDPGNPALIYDVNGDNAVNVLDAFSLWQHIIEGGDYNELWDFNEDGYVNVLDWTNLVNGLPEPPFDICQFVHDGEGGFGRGVGMIDQESINYFQEFELAANQDNMDYFLLFYGRSVEDMVQAGINCSI